MSIETNADAQKRSDLHSFVAVSYTEATVHVK